jgi:transposase-like protein
VNHDRIITTLKGGSMVTNQDIESIISLINTRFDDVVEANKIEKSEDNFQYIWIKGIYTDIKEYLTVALKQ